jgi:hypothetical protein
MKCDSAQPHMRMGMLDLMVRWYLSKTRFTILDGCSITIGISMKMLIIELKTVD